ncbi:hypothetical protein D5086_015222 [Populus alba]|uniref:Uncharacterized protein n=1 Tax=Populus alba TaxID=43335 RepID=A0ACC4C117_POPAL
MEKKGLKSHDIRVILRSSHASCNGSRTVRLMYMVMEEFLQNYWEKSWLFALQQLKVQLYSILRSLSEWSGFKALIDFLQVRDDVKEKKPDPSIYVTASKRLGVSERDCLVVEDSVIGLQVATTAGMSCVITYTPSTADQDMHYM